MSARKLSGQPLTWFGGRHGVVLDAKPAELHLIDPDSAATFCGLSASLVRRVTKREANRDGIWCLSCFNQAQETQP